MDEARILTTLEAAERAAERGEPVGQAGFWSVVAAVKGDPVLRDRYGPWVAEIDARAFRNWAFGRMPVAVGAFLAVLATGVGMFLVGLAYRVDEPANWIVFLAGTATLLGSTHGLTHFVVGRLLGIRFTHWFVAPKGRLKPGGIKVDYGSYLAAPARRRAWMHASAALVTKAIPLLLIGGAVAADLPRWVPWALVVLTAFQITTDLTLSTKHSDWRRFSREMAYARREGR